MVREECLCWDRIWHSLSLSLSIAPPVSTLLSSLFLFIKDFELPIQLLFLVSLSRFVNLIVRVNYNLVTIFLSNK